MKNKSFIIIAISLVLGIGTFLGIYKYVSRLEQKVTVVVAAKDIPPYTEITEEYIKEENKSNINIPEDFAPDIEVVKGMHTGAFGIYENEIVTRQKVRSNEEIKDYLLSYGVPSGKVAVALDVDLVRSVGGIIKDDDYVDISVITDQFEVTPIKSIKVLRVKDRDGSDMNKSKMDTPIPSAVILEATAAERDVVIKLTDRGKVHLSLKNPADVTKTEIDQSAVQKLDELKSQQNKQQEETINTETNVNTDETPKKVNSSF